MSVIAWDGYVLAADRQGTSNGLIARMPKIYRHEDDIIAFCGDHEEGKILLDWYRNGGIKADWPQFQTRDDYNNMVVLSKGEIYEFQAHGRILLVPGKIAAWGEGRMLAMGAMLNGASAIDAVKIACEHNIYCGIGVDAYASNSTGISMEFHEDLELTWVRSGQ